MPFPQPFGGRRWADMLSDDDMSASLARTQSRSFLSRSRRSSDGLVASRLSVFRKRTIQTVPEEEQAAAQLLASDVQDVNVDQTSRRFPKGFASFVNFVSPGGVRRQVDDVASPPSAQPPTSTRLRRFGRRSSAPVGESPLDQATPVMPLSSEQTSLAMGAVDLMPMPPPFPELVGQRGTQTADVPPAMVSVDVPTTHPSYSILHLLAVKSQVSLITQSAERLVKLVPAPPLSVVTSPSRPTNRRASPGRSCPTSPALLPLPAHLLSGAAAGKMLLETIQPPAACHSNTAPTDTKKRTALRPAVQIPLLAAHDPRVQARLKQIAVGKSTPAYVTYVSKVTPDRRSRAHPHTPEARRSQSSSHFMDDVMRWRHQLHRWDGQAEREEQRSACQKAPIGFASEREEATALLEFAKEVGLPSRAVRGG